MLTDISISTSCLTETWLTTGAGATAGGLVLGNPRDTNCWPVNQNAITVTLSPAICPNGYSSACDIDSLSRADASETLWACCPIGFVCDGGVYSCVRRLGNTQDAYFASDIDASGNTITKNVAATLDVNAHSIRVAFHSSDILGQAATATPAGTSATTLPTSTEPVEPITPGAQVLPPGAWVGVGIGSTAGAVLLIAAILWLVRRQRRNKREGTSGKHELPSSEAPKGPDPRFFSAATTPPVELHGTLGSHELGINPHDNTGSFRRV
ncbi:hypothetical protein SAMD00023353_5200620 [Rosellinia necatrix]|uniref:Uncharacterized protein n=1 Tax=Rosellinia necatrix TaxID=77044 RepID=A0A1W2TQJ7_ROSNE|nr:hypothetical protein SAMD00023353_5200620 [Rosellinia necatrix]